jgi:glyoxylase-like metal-dependent hydrolase (beta-lactamase superfamily II)
LKIKTITTWWHETDNLIIRDVPVSSTIVEMGSHLIIIDTGMVGNDQLIEELEEIGYSPSDFSMVINTHLHCDHIGGNRIFTNARILISRQELEFENEFALALQLSNDPFKTLRSMGRDIDESSVKTAWDVKQTQEEWPASKLVGDPAQIEFFENNPLLPDKFSLIKVPGHSIDSRAVIINGVSHQVAVTGDAFYHRDLWSVTIRGINYDDNLFQQNAKRLSHFKGIIIPGHDHAFDNSTGTYIVEDILEVYS